MSDGYISDGSFHRHPVNTESKEPYPLLAKVVSHLDPKYMGMIQVELLREVGNDDKKGGQLITVKYASPFMGITDVDFNLTENNFNGTQKSYGFWAIPPDVGNIVIVVFIDGDPKKGYWIACTQDLSRNFMIPGLAATSFNVDGIEERVPVAEFNHKAEQLISKDTTKIKKPQHPFTERLKNQGLLLDDVRGITTSSARRDLPSAVYGLSTPGPLDKSPNAPKSKQGKKESEGLVPWSRLGGTTLVMDDGDDKFLRRQSASEGPPDYASVEDGETFGDKKILHNELVRIRTRTGHQILLHNSEDLIYIGNARGTAWIELSSDGKMDIYCEDSISVHTKQDFNLYADRDINMEAGRNVNIKAKEETQIETGTNYKILVGNDGMLTIGGNYDVSTGGHIFETSGGSNETKAGGNIIETAPQIHMNGPSAATAEEVKPLKIHSVPDQEGNELFQTILRRVPTFEPWPHHENLDPEKYKPDQTDRDTEGRNEGTTSSMLFTPEYWKTYTTKFDTFAKIKKD